MLNFLGWDAVMGWPRFKLSLSGLFPFYQYFGDQRAKADISNKNR
jgi:hypothetical protein